MNTRGHTVHRLIDHGCHPYNLYGEQEETDPHMGVAIIMWSYNASQPLVVTRPFSL